MRLCVQRDLLNHCVKEALFALLSWNYFLSALPRGLSPDHLFVWTTTRIINNKKSSITTLPINQSSTVNYRYLLALPSKVKTLASPKLRCPAIPKTALQKCRIDNSFILKNSDFKESNKKQCLSDSGLPSATCESVSITTPKNREMVLSSIS